MKAESVDFGAGYSGYIAYPERAQLPLPAIIVIQEAWGVDAHIEDVTRRFAAAGYVAFAPDLYMRNGARLPKLDKETIAKVVAIVNANPAIIGDKSLRSAAFAAHPALEATIDTIFNNLQNPEYLTILEAAARFLHDDFTPSRGQKLASVGFCMGGRLSALLATRTSLGGAAILYGRSIPEEDMPKLRCPLLGFYGALDKSISDTVPAYAAALQSHGKSFTYQIYDGASHAFFNDTRPSYNAPAARDAFARLLTFFHTVLA